MRRLLIVGGGIAGLTLATALADLPIAIDLVEQRPHFTALGAGIVLHPNGMHVLQHLGLAQTVVRQGAPIRYLELLRESGLLRLPLAEVWGGAAQPTIALRRTVLHEILL